MKLIWLNVFCSICFLLKQYFNFRSTAIIFMRRAGIPWLTIAKITGHSSIENLIKHYDLKLEVLYCTILYCYSIILYSPRHLIWHHPLLSMVCKVAPVSSSQDELWWAQKYLTSGITKNNSNYRTVLLGSAWSKLLLRFCLTGLVD